MTREEMFLLVETKSKELDLDLVKSKYGIDISSWFNGGVFDRNLLSDDSDIEGLKDIIRQMHIWQLDEVYTVETYDPNQKPEWC